MATTRISTLTPYINTQIRGVDYLPIISPSIGVKPFDTFRASGEQIAKYVASTITDQLLTTSSSVIFSEISATNLKCVNLTATNLQINGLLAVAKHSFEINHTGGPGQISYNISHPISAENIHAQVFEKNVIIGGGVQYDLVITSISHFFQPTGNSIKIDIRNTLNATYKVVIMG